MNTINTQIEQIVNSGTSPTSPAERIRALTALYFSAKNISDLDTGRLMMSIEAQATQLLISEMQ